MESELHKELKYRARSYLWNKGYWICGTEVPMPVGVCDAWGMKHWGRDCMAIEVKVSRPDFRSASQRSKEFSHFTMGNLQYILCPADLVSPEELHNEWGLLWAKDGRIINKKKAPRLEMTTEQKMDVLMYFLDNGVNPKRPKLEIASANMVELPQTQSLAI